MIQIQSYSQTLLIVGLIGEFVMLLALIFSSKLTNLQLAIQAPFFKIFGKDIYDPYPASLPNFNMRRFMLILLRIILPIIMIGWGFFIFSDGLNIKSLTISNSGLDLAYPLNFKPGVHIAFDQISILKIGEAAQRGANPTHQLFWIKLQDGSVYSQTMNNIDEQTLVQIKNQFVSQPDIKCLKTEAGGNGSDFNFEYGTEVTVISRDASLCH